MIELAAEHDDIVLLIWQISDPSYPEAEERFLLLGGEELPLGIFSVSTFYTGEDLSMTNYSSLVLQSSFEDSLNISQAVESIILSKTFINEEYYDPTALRSVVLIQDINSREVLQAAQIPVTQLIPTVEVNLYFGPANLGIYFQNISFPVGELNS